MFCQQALQLPRWKAVLLLGAVLSTGAAQAADAFLDPVQAFKLSARVLDAKRLEVRFDIAPGYYLYRDKFTATSPVPGVTLSTLEVPPGKVKFDENFGKNVEYFRDSVVMVLPVQAGEVRSFTVDVGNQGCADKGLCYPPMKRPLSVSADASGLAKVSFAAPAPKEPQGGLLSQLLGKRPTAEAAPVVSESVAPATKAPAGSPGSESANGLASSSSSASTSLDLLASEPARPAAVTSQGTSGVASGAPSAASAAELSGADAHFSQALASRKLLTVAGVFLVAGLLLAFTPCVLPMLPILSSIILGQNERVSKARGFSLALSYSMGMAIVYTAFGIAAALAGSGLGAYLQNAWVLGAFGLLMVVLALSMFDVYDLQMPQALHNGLSGWSSRFQGGQYAGVFIMGGLSAAIVSPCIAAPLAGALVYIGQTRDVTLGGVALFSLAMGMSVPLLLVGVSAGVLPRSGGWMKQVKHLFGVLMLGLALWIVAPVVPVWFVMLGTAVLLLATAVYLGAFEPLNGHMNPGRTMTKGVGLALALAAAVQLVGVASGGRDLLQPLGHFGLPSARAAEGTATSSAAMPLSGELHFKPIASLQALDAAVKASTTPVMVDFYADWCVACKEFERFTLSDSRVRAKLSGMTLLRADVTANNEQDRALMRKYHLFGPPAMLFIPAAGEEASGTRVIGYKSASEFLDHLARIEPLLVAR
ncbi:MAG: hypothetical protein RLZZ618_534 [Pseudomonadota bacterium]